MSAINLTFENTHVKTKTQVVKSRFAIFFYLIFSAFLGLGQNTAEDLCANGKATLFSKKAFLKAGNAVSISHLDVKKLTAKWNVDFNSGYLIGTVSQIISSAKNDSLFRLDLNNLLTVNEVLVNEISTEFSHVNDKILIPFDIIANRNYEVTVVYEGLPTLAGNRSYEFKKHQNTPIVWTLSEPYGAKDWWPCIQALNYKIDSTIIEITFPKQYKSASNGLLTQRIENDSLATERWEHYHPINFYLIAFAVTNYEEYSFEIITQSGNVFFQNLVYPESNSPENQAKINTTANFLHFFDSLLVPYPFANEKYGHAQFGFGGGMEHQTMSFMLNYSFDLVAHELAHQWFGDYITCNSWSDLWLNEGFATYCTYLAHERFHTEEVAQAWLKKRLAGAKNAITKSLFVKDTLDISVLFSQNRTYSKGALVLHMLRNKIGDTAFFNGLRAYINDTKTTGFATSLSLQTALETASNQNLEAYFSSWVYGNSYPIVTYSWDTQGNDLILNLSQAPKETGIQNTFELDNIPVFISGLEKDTVIYLNLYSNQQSFQIPIGTKIKDVKLDPNGTLLADMQLLSGPKSLANNSLLLFPNPASTQLHVFGRSPAYRIENLYVFDAQGALVKKQHFSNQKNAVRLSISDLQDGIYFLKVNDKSAKNHIRFSKISTD